MCKACSTRRPIAVGAQTNPVLWRGGGRLLEPLHTGPLQPCYVTGFIFWQYRPIYVESSLRCSFFPCAAVCQFFSTQKPFLGCEVTPQNWQIPAPPSPRIYIPIVSKLLCPLCYDLKMLGLYIYIYMWRVIRLASIFAPPNRGATDSPSNGLISPYGWTVILLCCV